MSKGKNISNMPISDVLRILTDHKHYVKSLQYMEEDKRQWDNIRDKDTLLGYREYLESFHDGRYIHEAQERVKYLSEDENDWKAAQKENTIESYNIYVNKHQENGKFYAKALNNIALINENNLWEETKCFVENTESLEEQISFYESYLKNSKLKINENKAKEEIATLTSILEDNHLWETIKEHDNESSYEQYLQQFPTGRHIDQATRRLSEIKADLAAWQLALDKDSESGYQEYLHSFASGKYIEEAKQKLKVLKDDHKAWIKANSKNTIKAYKDYIKKFSNGQYVKQASKQLKEIENDILAWEVALKQNDKNGYEQYLKNYPSGLYKDKANEKLKFLREDEHCWKDVLDENSIQAYERYIELFPNGIYIKKAKENLKDIQLWKEIEDSEDKKDFENYLKKHPNGIFKNSAEKKLRAIKNKEKALEDERQAKMEEEKLWQETRRFDNLTSYRRYLKQYKNGQYLEEAQERLRELESDKASWENAKKINNMSAYKNYIKEFPNGKYISQAISKRDNLLVIIEDKNTWERAETRDTIEAYNAYLNLCPNGQYKLEAQKRLNDLKAKEEKERVIKKDKEAWEKAKSRNTKEAYAKYLQDFPTGQYRNNARENLNKLIEIEESRIIITNLNGKNIAENDIDIYEKYAIPEKMGKLVAYDQEFDRDWHRTLLLVGLSASTVLVIITMFAKFEIFQLFLLFIFGGFTIAILIHKNSIQFVATNGFGKINYFGNGSIEPILYYYKDIKKIVKSGSAYKFYNNDDEIICEESGDLYRAARNYFINKDILDDS